MQCLEAEGFLLLAPELAGGAKGLGEGVVGQIHRQVMAHAQVGYHRFEDRLGFPLEALPIGYGGFTCLLYTSPSPRDKRQSRMPSSA